MRFNHVLLATNGSESSSKAEDYAFYLGENHDLTLTVIYVLEDNLCHYGEVDTLAPLEARESFISYVIDEQKEVASDLAKALQQKVNKYKNVEYAFKVAQGDPADVIASIAKEEKVDLIVLGGKRLKKKRGFRIISLADKLTALTDQSISIII